MHNSNLEYAFKTIHGMGSNSCQCPHYSHGVFGFAELAELRMGSSGTPMGCTGFNGQIEQDAIMPARRNNYYDLSGQSSFNERIKHHGE
ncbi:MAG: hypothetical protein HYT70_01245 [Candidatus Aenigmarchaeota archaeon]|nr:hypothetical protein [Candidatus Aenigmarchaeota archaeon]